MTRYWQKYNISLNSKFQNEEVATTILGNIGQFINVAAGERGQGRHLVQVKQAGVSWSPYYVGSFLFSFLFIYLHFHFRRLRDKRLIEISERERERETSYNKRDIKVVPIQTKLVGNDNSKEILLIKQLNHTSGLREK